jgi:hypothetical protein
MKRRRAGVRVAVLGAPGPAARSERVASGGRGLGLKRFDNDCGMWTCGLLWFTTEKYCN